MQLGLSGTRWWVHTLMGPKIATFNQPKFEGWIKFNSSKTPNTKVQFVDVSIILFSGAYKVYRNLIASQFFI